MATLDDVAHLAGFQDALLVGRHPLLTTRDVAALCVSGALSPAVLETFWRRVARDLRAAVEDTSPYCRNRFSPGPLRVLSHKDDVLGLSATDTAAVATAMGVTRQKSGAETAVAILEAHHAARAIASHPLGPAYIQAYRHLNAWRVTRSTALKHWKLRPAVLDEMPCQLAPSPYPGGHDMCLYNLRDVVSKATRAWVPDPVRPLMPDSLWRVGTVRVTTPASALAKRRRAPWTCEADVYAAAEQERRNRQRRAQEAEQKRQRQEAERAAQEALRRQELDAQKAAWEREIDPHKPRCLVCGARTKSHSVKGILEHMRKFHRDDVMTR